jgi:hypothetical protein
VSDERRQFQRLDFDEPLDGWFGDFPVRLINVSGSGVLVQCDEEIATGARALLRFFWGEHEIELLAEMTRDGKDGAGLAFVDDPAMLRDLIADSTTQMLRAQEANARGNREQNVYGDQTLTAASSKVSSTYTTWIYEDSTWRSRRSLVPDQPANGFTVYSGEPEDQVNLLKRTYEKGDTETRRLTRVFAELSVVSAPKPAPKPNQ